MKKLFILFIIAGLYSCSSNSTSGSTDSVGVDASKAVVRRSDAAGKDTTTKKADTATATSPAAEGTGWAYSDEVDKMTSKKGYYAKIDANELLDFPSPYDGGSTAELTIRCTGNKNEAILSVSKGQFITHVDGGAVKVRFDTAQPVTFSTSEPSDGSTDALFIENAAKLIKKIKTANKIIIEAEFYDSGLKTMEFNVKGFQWAH